MADLIPFPRLADIAEGDPQLVAEFVHWTAERREPCRATSDYLNRPCRSPAELERLLRESADTTACREGG